MTTPELSAGAIDPIPPPPIFTGSAGRAWRCDLAALAASQGADSVSAAIAQWVIECPRAHPIWHSYLVTLIHLRPLPTLPQVPLIYRAGATHEFWLEALDPNHPRAPGIAGVAFFHALQPPNFVAQLIEPDDTAAVKTIEIAVRDVVAGRLNPDTDFRGQWAARFGDAMLRRRGSIGTPH